MDIVVGCNCSIGDEGAHSGNVDIGLLFVVHVWFLLHNCNFSCLVASFYFTWTNCFSS